MKDTIPNRCIYFDVDETLIQWEFEPDFVVTHEHQMKLPEDFILIDDIRFRIHKPHIMRLMQHHNTGDCVVVWSAGGINWARRVIEALAIQDYVNVVLGKPDFFYDDENIPCLKGKRMYLNIDTGKFERG